MNIPFFIVLTKLDISPKNVTERTIKDLKDLFVRFSKNKKLKVNKTVELVNKNYSKDIIPYFKDNYNKIVPIFPVSSVSGEGITCVREFITGLDPRKSFDTSPNYPVNFVIESSYLIHGIGIVVSGFLQGGVIKIGDQLSLGPYYGKFYKIVIKSIHNNFRESITELWRKFGMY